jgi:multidrug resistance efflux pump
LRSRDSDASTSRTTMPAERVPQRRVPLPKVALATGLLKRRAGGDKRRRNEQPSSSRRSPRPSHRRLLNEPPHYVRLPPALPLAETVEPGPSSTAGPATSSHALPNPRMPPMSREFTRTMTSIERGQPRRRSTLATAALVLLVAWWTWLVKARVSVVVSSNKARLEAASPAFRVAAADSGRLIAHRLELGRPVESNEVLAELDSTVERGRVAEAKAQLGALTRRMDFLQAQVAAETDADSWREVVDGTDVDLADVGERTAAERLSTRGKLLVMEEGLYSEGLSSTMEAVRAAGARDEFLLAVKGARLTLTKAKAARRRGRAQARVRIASLLAQLAELEAEATLTTVRHDNALTAVELRAIRSPASGVLGGVNPVRVGDVLRSGDVLATVVLSDGIQAVADFTPADALGRIRPGQRANLRLYGFTWSEFGLVGATVRRVANEPLEGVVRVELELDREIPAGIPLQHGLPGAAEVEVEQVSPWQLFLRGLGRTLEPAPAKQAPSPVTP